MNVTHRLAPVALVPFLAACSGLAAGAAAALVTDTPTAASETDAAPTAASKTDAAPTAAPRNDAAPKADTTPTASPAAAPSAPIPAGMVEHDLSPLDPKWQGWVAAGPKDAKIAHDLGSDARLVVDGKGLLAGGPPEDEFDLIFRQAKRSFDEEKELLKSIPTNPSPGVTRKLVVITDTPDKLEWTDATTIKGKTSTHYHFVVNFQVAGKDVSCSTAMQGAATKAGLAQFEAACLTLHKR